MPHVVDANDSHHDISGRYVTPGRPEVPGAAAALARREHSAAQLRSDARLELEYQIKGIHSAAVSATIENGRLTSVRLADDTTVTSFADANPGPAEMSVIGLSDRTSVEVKLDRTAPVSTYKNRVMATFQYQQAEDNSDDLYNVGSETVDVTDILASMAADSLNLDDPDYMHEDYDLRDEIYYSAENAGIISPPDGCAFEVDVNRDQFEAFAAERLDRDAADGGQGACILTGEPGENDDDCTTHEHES